MNDTVMEFYNVLSGPLSREAQFKLYYSGPYRSREIGHLIKQLELVRGFLSDEEQLEGIEQSADDEPALNPPSP